MTNPSPQPLPWLLRRLTQLVEAATDALEAEYPGGVSAWQQELSRQLARYSAASYMAGASVDTLSAAATKAVVQDIAVQLRFLGKFAIEVKDGKQWQRGWNARAAMYAQSIKAPYWRGRTQLLPLPAVPGDGTTQCLTNCLCAWEIETLDGENNYDCYWRRAADDSCQTCVQRERDWSPLQIRDGVVQI